MKALLLANHEAAGGRAARLLPQLRDFLHARVSSLEFAHTRTAAQLRQLATEAAAVDYERVFVAGGDGTAHAALNALRGTETALGLLPLGHGNDLARALGVPLDPRAAAEFLLQARVSSIDLARVGKESYACVGSVGFDAETNRRANAWGSWPSGHTRYLLAGLCALVSYRPISVELVTDSEKFSGDVMLVAVANTPNYGGGLRVTPRAKMDDGLLDVCVIERVSRPALLGLYLDVRAGRHLQAASVRYFCAARVHLRAPTGAQLFADGEFLASLPLEIGIEPAAVRVLRRQA